MGADFKYDNPKQGITTRFPADHAEQGREFHDLYSKAAHRVQEAKLALSALEARIGDFGGEIVSGVTS